MKSLKHSENPSFLLSLDAKQMPDQIYNRSTTMFPCGGTEPLSSCLWDLAFSPASFILCSYAGMESSLPCSYLQSFIFL